ncbi:MAG: amino acid adenylation domain-containing protein, partial [bacterium]|nr:amino acid adenylation domain-containing protein [bacterium]
MYTSGSTGKPKGVMIEHRNSVNMITFDNRHTTIDFSKLLQFHSIAFDVSFQEIFSVLLSGGILYLLSNESRTNIVELLNIVARHHIPSLYLPMSILRLIFGEAETIERLPRCIRHILTAGEQVVINESFKTYLHRSGVYLHNLYGPTETHVATMLTIDPRGDIHRLPTIGRPILNTAVYILDRNNRLLPTGAAGELCIGGAQVGRGYLNRPQLTAEKFERKKFELAPILYHTGDLARWLPDRNIQFLGRIDHQVKIRGFRVEPGEIENRLLNHPRIKEAVVIPRRGESGDNYLCAYFTSGQAPTVSELRDYLSGILPDYMVPSYFMHLDAIPVTANGKVNRNALPEPVIESSDSHIAPTNAVEKKVAELWEQVLEISPGTVSIDTGFFHLGGHSLNATVLVSRIHKEFRVTVPLLEVFRNDTVRRLSAYIKGAAKTRYSRIEPVEKRDYYSLSSAQKRIYVLQQMDLDNTAYNMPMILPLAPDAEPGKLESVFSRLIARHESLRTSFITVDNQPVQKMHDHVEFEIELFGRGDPPWSPLNGNHSGTHGEGSHRENIHGEGSHRGLPLQSQQDFIRHFDLSRAPLLRVGLIEREPGSKGLPHLMIDMHHIISDGISLDVLTEDFLALYEGKELAPLRIQYKDFSHRQTNERETKFLEGQAAYWLREFKEDIPILAVLTDYPRPPSQSFEGDAAAFEMSEEISHRLKALALEHRITLYMLLLGMFYILLSKLSGQEDIVVGTPVAGRLHADLERVIGMFVNTLALRNHPERHQRVPDFLANLKKRTLEAFENQEYPFEELVEQVEVKRDISRNPLFDMMFSLIRGKGDSAGPDDAQSDPLSHTFEHRVAKIDLSLEVVNGDRLTLLFEYCTKLFKKETIQRFARYFTELASDLLARPRSTIEELEIIPPEEKQRILEDFNDTQRSYPADRTIPQLFQEQVERTPDNIAVSGVTTRDESTLRFPIQITYRELSHRSQRLAVLLKEKGVRADVLVAIMADKSLELIIGILGILYAGGAYLPIDPAYPEERIEFMLKDSGAKIIVTNGLKVNGLDGLMVVKTKPGDANQLHNQPTNLAYIIYTSGSTGKPKGVMLQHQGISSLIVFAKEDFKVDQRDRVVQFASISFDASVWEITMALLNGAALYLVGKEIIGDHEEFSGYITRHTITIATLPPAYAAHLDPVKMKTLRLLVTAGSASSPLLVEKWSRRLQYVNGYGPTETTICASVWYADSKTGPPDTVPIGKPLVNTNIYILDTHSSRIQPIGVAGELCVAGVSVARGYLNRPELTAEKFEKTKFELNSTLYHTGDLARWLSDGNIEFLGRIDLQVKIRGYRVEPGEIEEQLLNHESVKDVAVLARTDDAGERFLCAYVAIVPGKDDGISKLREYLARRLPDYMIPAFFVIVEDIPLTSSGKVDHRALPVPGAEAGEDYVAPRNHIEKKLVAMWSELLIVDRESIGIDAGFFELGGHSLKATFLISQIHKELSVKIPMQELFTHGTIRGLAELIGKSTRETFTSIEPVERKEYYELSFNQNRLWILHQRDRDSNAFNMPGQIVMNENADAASIRQIIAKLIERHESLRTAFKEIDGQAVQYIVGDYDIPFETVDISDVPGETEKQSRITGIIHTFSMTPFDLERPPLLKTLLLKIAEGSFIFAYNTHHIVSDGWSSGILERDFHTLYQAYLEDKPMVTQAPGVSYKDFCAWQNRRLQDPAHRGTSHRFWKEFLKDQLPIPRIPGDFDDDGGIKPGANYRFVIPAEFKDAMITVSKEHNITLFALLYAIFNLFLSKVSGQPTVVSMIINAGRPHPGLRDTVGFFVNSLVFKTGIDEEEVFTVFAANVQQLMLEIFEHQHHPLELVLDEVGIQYPQVNTAFNMLNQTDTGDIEMGNLDSFHIPDYESQNVKFDLEPYISEYKNGIQVNVAYNKNLFKAESIEIMMTKFRKMVEFFAINPHKRLEDYSETRKKKSFRRKRSPVNDE